MQKERYFTPETMHRKSLALLAPLKDFRKGHSGIRFQPASAALLVLDLQEYFFKEESHAFIPSAPPILPGISKLLCAFLDAGLPVIATRHVNTLGNAGMMAKWWRDILESKSAYSHNNTTITTKKVTAIKKTQYDAFLQTELEDILLSRGVQQVVICGVMTHLCCETTARSAFMRGFEVFFTIDGTATYTEQLHSASLLTLSHGFAIAVLIDELLSELELNET